MRDRWGGREREEKTDGEKGRDGGTGRHRERQTWRNRGRQSE